MIKQKTLDILVLLGKMSLSYRKTNKLTLREDYEEHFISNVDEEEVFLFLLDDIKKNEMGVSSKLLLRYVINLVERDK